jgi:cellulose synthase/poly-beta-1,6-N-acetylglucosamine synthase-like glycosyltransferase
MAALSLYGLHRISMVWRFRRRTRGQASGLPGEPFLPSVTVQLPIFNERTVAARLIRAAGSLDYPRDRIEIQVLDDSTDDTREIVDEELRALRSQGVRAELVRRDRREGYKAGALKNGMPSARGELLCIFDADFVPEPPFLRQLVGHFADPKVGMVQARWGHKNRSESWLTRAESTLLDGHFVVEHAVRFEGGLFFNFNGTAGIWRKSTIEDAGGWQHDTLTEDLDLSYRAQLAGWRFVYASEVVAPAEVPPSISAFKSQQHRWAKGSVQVARKLLWQLVRSNQPARVKLEALAHLGGNTGYPLVLLLALLLPLVMTTKSGLPQWVHLAAFVLCTLSVVEFYDAGQRAQGRPGRARIFDTLAAMTLGIGMCVAQTRAVVEGFLRKTGVFVRTPKHGGAPASRRYAAHLLGVPGLELVLAAWFAWSLPSAAAAGAWGALPFLLLFFCGFTWVGGLSLCEWVVGAASRSSSAKAGSC